MTKRLLKILTILSCFFFSLNLVSSSIFAVSDSTNIFLEVTSFCGNGVCESIYGENENTCPIDCGCNNNGICEPERGETSANCPLDCPEEEEEEEEAVGGGRAFFDTTPPIIFNLFISKITLNSVEISWETNEQALCQVFWGKTDEYREGSISEQTFYRQHSTEIINLSPATVYHFKIVCRDTNYNKNETIDQKFTTLTPPDITPPANVSEFKAVAGDKEITLSWKNPPDTDFKGVRIVRSEKFYPSDPFDGEVVYDDKGTFFVDTGLKNGIRYYYTAFAYDKTRNYASGAIASAVPLAPIPPEEIPPKVPPIVPPPPEEIPPVVSPPPKVEKVKIEDFDFIQKEEKIPIEKEKIIKAKSATPLTISVNYEKVPEVLKTIMVTIEKENNSNL